MPSPVYVLQNESETTMQGGKPGAELQHAPHTVFSQQLPMPKNSQWTRLASQ
jgi:hypothetical protein